MSLSMRITRAMTSTGSSTGWSGGEGKLTTSSDLRMAQFGSAKGTTSNDKALLDCAGRDRRIFAHSSPASALYVRRGQRIDRGHRCRCSHRLLPRDLPQLPRPEMERDT